MSQNPVYTFAKWQVKEGRLDNVLKLLTEVAEQSSQEEGNLFYKVHQSKSDANTLILLEAYADETALEEHRNSAHFKTLVIGQIMPDLENREVIVTSQLIS
jgi:autoinducer 2-degrading protein